MCESKRDKVLTDRTWIQINCMLIKLCSAKTKNRSIQATALERKTNHCLAYFDLQKTHKKSWYYKLIMPWFCQLDLNLQVLTLLFRPYKSLLSRHHLSLLKQEQHQTGGVWRNNPFICVKWFKWKSKESKTVGAQTDEARGFSHPAVERELHVETRWKTLRVSGVRQKNIKIQDSKPGLLKQQHQQVHCIGRRLQVEGVNICEGPWWGQNLQQDLITMTEIICLLLGDCDRALQASLPSVWA